MTATELAKEARRDAMRQHAVVMEALEDDDFMTGVARALADEAAGVQGKSFKQIREERDL